MVVMEDRSGTTDDAWSGNGDATDRAVAVGTGVLLVVSGGAMGLFLALVVVTVLGGLGVPLDRQVVTVPTLSVAQQVGFAAVVAGYVVASRRPGLIRASGPDRRELAVAGAGVVALLAVSMLITALLSYLDVPAAQNRIEQIGRENPQVMVYMVPVAVLVIGPAEELLFRGAIQGRLRTEWGPVAAIGIASALFAVAHVLALDGSSRTAQVVTIGALLVLSLVLGTIYEYTGNIVVPALVHGGYDAVLFAYVYLSVT